MVEQWGGRVETGVEWCGEIELGAASLYSRWPVHGGHGDGAVQWTDGRVRRVGARPATVLGYGGGTVVAWRRAGQARRWGTASGLIWRWTGTHGRRVSGGLVSLLGEMRVREGAGEW